MAQQGISQHVIGHAGEPVYTETNDIKNLRFSVAVTHEFKTDGQKDEHTEWTNCEVTGARAAGLKERLKSGAYLSVDGDIRVYRAKNAETGGETIRRVLRVDRLLFLDKAPKSGANAPHPQATSHAEPEMANA